MTLSSLLVPNQLYTIISQSEYPTILELCRSNRQINQLCRTDSQIYNLIKQKRVDYETKQRRIKSETDRFLGSPYEHGYTRWYPIEDAIRENVDIEIIDELMRRGYAVTGQDIINAFRDGRISLGIQLLKDPTLFQEVIRQIPAIDRMRLHQSALYWGNTELADFIQQNPDVLH